MTVILVDRQEAREVEHEEKVKWIRSILERIGVPLDDWPENPSMAYLRSKRVLFRKLGINIIDDSNNGILIYWEDDLVAQWQQPWYKLVEDPNEKDVQYRFYYEMHLRNRSVFDERATEEGQPLEENDS